MKKPGEEGPDHHSAAIQLDPEIVQRVGQAMSGAIHMLINGPDRIPLEQVLAALPAVAATAMAYNGIDIYPETGAAIGEQFVLYHQASWEGLKELSPEERERMHREAVKTSQAMAWLIDELRGKGH